MIAYIPSHFLQLLKMYIHYVHHRPKILLDAINLDGKVDYLTKKIVIISMASERLGIIILLLSKN